MVKANNGSPGPPPAPSAPTITAVSAGSITTASAAISWTTDVPATTQVEYGLTIAYGTLTPVNATLVTAHSAALSGLQAGTSYHYRVRSKDSSNQESLSGDFTFATSTAVPGPPKITAVSAGSITTASAAISWTTDVPATTQVEYGLTIAYGTLTPVNATLVTAHSAALSGLQAGTSYHYRVRSKDSSNQESLSGDFTFATNTVGDTTPPTVSVTAPAGGSTVSGTIPVTASAADNVGVAGVQFLLDGVNLGGEVAAAPYSISWDTGTTTNASHTLTARARDAAGNTATSVAVTVTVNNVVPGGNADLDFQARCTAPGVIRCIGFDNPADFAPQPDGYNDGLHSASDGTYQGTMDTTIKTSGAGSLKFTIRPNTSANVAGYYLTAFNQVFGARQTFYMQFRQRMASDFVNYQWEKLGGGAWKQYIIYYQPGASCRKTQLVLHEWYDDKLPEMYTECGAVNLVTNNGVPPYLLQQGDYNCWYKNFVAPDCFFYPVDTWVTWYLQVDIGDWGVANSHIQAWVAIAGAPYKQFVNLPNFVLNQDAPGMNVMMLTPYMTGKNPAVATPLTYTWYDELIVSTQPIAAPKQ